MESEQVFSKGNYFGKYEIVVRKELGDELDGFKNFINQIQGKCSIRMITIDFHKPDKGSPITVESLKGYNSDSRCKILAALLYSDALWRLEAAHLMMCTGILNVAYANLRTALDALAAAFIVERCDEEALNFLKNEDYEVNLKLAAKFIKNTRYKTALLDMKKVYSGWGVHPCFQSLQLSSLFGASRFDKFVTESKTKVQKKLQLPEGFVDVAKSCIKQGNQVGILFMWLESIPVKS